MVIPGGGANLINIANLIRSLSGETVRTGTPRHLFSASGCEGATTVSAAASIGMILAAKKDNIPSCTTPASSLTEEDGIEIENVAEEEEAEVQIVEDTAAQTGEESAAENFGEQKKEEENHGGSGSNGSGNGESGTGGERGEKHEEGGRKNRGGFFKGKLKWIVKNLYDNSAQEDREDEKRY